MTALHVLEKITLTYYGNGMEFYTSKIYTKISDLCHNKFETQYYNELFDQLEEISQYLNFSCSHILNSNRSALSGYYTLPASNGSLISVYCDMEGQCDGKGGWMKVGYINMSEPGNNCPSGLKSYNFEIFNYPFCD